MKTRTAPAFALMFLATAMIIGLTTGSNASASDIEGRAINADITNSIGMDIAINNMDIDSIEGMDINSIEGMDIAEINSNIEEDINQRTINNIDNMGDIAIADRISSIREIGDMDIMGIAEINRIDGADMDDISANI